ncbi:DNA-binding FadR family transcriptional regulator [Agromyces flavus]|uniref:DNA-binding FadR family transcriptional regulator n=1 Tax=Agromyces flavus TaxID=589382 RepID=A0A1H1W991_9MICO|nr:FadR/GntR family transcriptional regulator [Agromyces flavus]MCP2366116.1 DNA-binding FadR family transcriptional regulator [Agromyces flavus]SDS93673.1 DNA-binding transcriptional regulator, FadR family [Agromyces flavus]
MATGSRSNVVIDGIRRMITSGELVAGSRLPVERELGARLGVSRGPLREGVRALVVLGVLETRQGDGTYVTSLEPGQLLEPLGMLAELQSPENSVHLLGVRRVLEPEVAAQAALRVSDEQLAEARRILERGEAILDADGDIDLEGTIDVDTDFHRLVATASGNPAFAAIIEALVSRTARARLWRAIHERGAVHDTQREHRAILNALEAHDPDRARIRMSVHVLGVEEFTARHLDEQPVADES